MIQKILIFFAGFIVAYVISFMFFSGKTLKVANVLRERHFGSVISFPPEKFESIRFDTSGSVILMVKGFDQFEWGSFVLREKNRQKWDALSDSIWYEARQAEFRGKAFSDSIRF